MGVWHKTCHLLGNTTSTTNDYRSLEPPPPPSTLPAHPQVEYLWVPGAFLQPCGSARMEVCDGRIVTVQPVRANAGRALTVEVCASAVPSLYVSVRRTRVRSPISVCRASSQVRTDAGRDR